MKQRSRANAPTGVKERAEGLVAGRAPSGEPVLQDQARLLHDLEVHRVELETQNEELRRVQRELEESRDRYYELYDLAPVSYVTLDRQGRILEANLMATTLLGAARGSLVGRALSSFMSIASADAFHKFRARVFATHRPLACDLDLRRPDGRDLPVHVEAISTLSREGAPCSCRCAIIDVSALRSAESEARAAQAKSRTLLETATDAIVTTDAAGKIESVNAAAERIFGYGSGELLGHPVRLLLADGFDQASPLPQAGEGFGRRKDGRTIPMLLGIGAFSQGDEERFAIIFHDMTGRRAAEERLRESEERFRQIAENVEDVFYLREADGRFSYVSPAYERLAGRSPAELRRASDAWITAIHPDDRGRVVDARVELRKGDPFDVEYRVRRPDGAKRWVRDRAFPIYGAEGRLLRDVGVIQDITVERELEEELRQAQKMEAVGVLASGVAHDFNNVLHVVLGFAEMLRVKRLPREQAEKYVARIAKAARRGAELTAQLLTFARKDAQAPRPLELDAVVTTAASLVQRLVTEKVKVEVEAGAPLRAILADPVQIEQMLMNLASNARDAMPAGGTLRIRTDEVTLDRAAIARLGLREASRYVRLVVEDTGIGMDDATQQRVFEPFFTTKSVGRGTGLGLATVFATTGQLGGHIEVESARGEGSKFTILLPCTDDAPAPSPPSEEPPRLRGKALLVEDEPLVRATVRSYLEDLGLAVVEAGSGAEAERMFDEERGFDVLVTDIVMPEMMGTALADRLHERSRDLRVLFISANPGQAAMDACACMSKARVLAKPFGRRDLADALAHLVGDHAQASFGA